MTVDLIKIQSKINTKTVSDCYEVTSVRKLLTGGQRWIQQCDKEAY